MTDTHRQLVENVREPYNWEEEQDAMKRSLEISSKALDFFKCLSHFSNPSFNCEEQSVSENDEHKCPTDHYQHDSFCLAFLKLARSQRREFLFKVMEIFHEKNNKQFSSQSSESFNTEFKCLFRSKGCLFNKWDQGKVILDYQLKKLTISQNGHEDMIDLKAHIPRKAQEKRFCLAFEFVGPVSLYNFSFLRICFEEEREEEFILFEKSVMKISADAVASKLERLVRQKTLILHLKRQKKNIRIWTRPQYLNRISDNEELRRPQISLNQSSISNQPDTNHESMVAPCSEIQPFTTLKADPQFTIKISDNDNSLLNARLFLKEVPRSKSLSNFLIKYKNNHKMIYRLTVLQDHKKTSKEGLLCKTIAIYQKVIWRQRIYGQMLIAQHQNFIEHPTPNSLIFNFHNIDSHQNISFIQKMKVACKELPNGQFSVDVLVKFYRQRQFTREAYVSFMQCFRDVFTGLSILSQLQSDTKFIRNDMLSLFLPDQTSFEGLESDNEEGEPHEVSRHEETNNNNILLEESQMEDDPSGYLKNHQLLPSPEKQGVLMKDHFLWKNWKRDQNGGLVCRDQQLVARQKKMAKIVLAKFGQTILKGKNVINFSLPVVVFKKESHLQSIARTYLYSPVFTQRAAQIKDPLQRMKYSIIIMMTQNALSIHMEKPFNPILGETYQGWIDGCPIYLQQISHHPPISAYYFVGRGYKKYGSIEPRISFGLNKASGYSSNPHYTEFADGMKIQYICAKIAIGGILIGDRTFKFEDKIYAYDRKHRFFASMKFGPKEEGFFSSSPEPQDYFHGFIYQVTADFQLYFDQSMPRRHPEEKHIVKKLAEFDGIWNSFVNINKEEVVNFKTDMPYMFTVEKNPLPSDSKHRKDLIELLKGDVESAQEQKERMEEEQRRDQKLREQNSK